jgi:hypothetical protein
LSAALPSPCVGCPSLSVVALSLLMISGCLCLSLLGALSVVAALTALAAVSLLGGCPCFSSLGALPSQWLLPWLPWLPVSARWLPLLLLVGCPSLSVVAALTALAACLCSVVAPCWLPFPFVGGCPDCNGSAQWLPLLLVVGCPSLPVVAALTALAAVSLLVGCPSLSVVVVLRLLCSLPSCCALALVHLVVHPAVHAPYCTPPAAMLCAECAHELPQCPQCSLLLLQCSLQCSLLCSLLCSRAAAVSL